MNNNIKYIYEYLPVRYEANEIQQKVRNVVYAFKDGRFDKDLLELFINQINDIIQEKPDEWVIAVIPASAKLRTIHRYASLLMQLSKVFNVEPRAIYNETDRPSTLDTGKLDNPTKSFAVNKASVEGKNILLIDDVITTGRSFHYCSELLKANGAKAVSGLFLAKTINPDRI